MLIGSLIDHVNKIQLVFFPRKLLKHIRPPLQVDEYKSLRYEQKLDDLNGANSALNHLPQPNYRNNRTVSQGTPSLKYHEET